MQVLGAEHYQQSSHGFICSSCPIQNPKGNLIGVVTIMGPKEFCQEHTLGMVCVAADGIEKALSMQNVCEELSRTNRVVERMIDSFPSSVLVLDEKDRIVKYSKKTLHALKLNRKNGIAGKTVFELIKRDSIPDVLEDLK